MRAIAFVALFAVAATALMFEPPSVAPAPMPPHSVTSAPDRGDAPVERLVHTLAEAVMRKDFKQVDKLLADNGVFFDSSNGCDNYMNKTAFIDLMKNVDVASQIIQILESTVSSGNGLFRVQDAFMLPASSQWANFTSNKAHTFVSAVPTPDGSQIQYLQKWEFTDQKTNNGMIATWNAWVAAASSANATAMDAILSSNATYMVFPPHAKERVMLNRSSILAELEEAHEKREWMQTSLDFMFPSCTMVGGSLVAFEAWKDGRRNVNKYFVGLALDVDFKISAANIFPLFQAK